MNNVLILSAGRRVELVQAFQAELRSRGLSSKTYATDLFPELSSACQVVDVSIKAPRVTDPAYIDFLLRACIDNEISMVIPTIDTELLLLAQSRARFAEHGVDIIVSNEGLVAICRDKRLTSDLFEGLGIATPKIFDRNAIEFPCFAKPYDGSCSVGASALFSREMMTGSIADDEKMMFMELIDDSHTEFTVDIYFSRYGELVSLVPRERIEVRGGEVSKGATRLNEVYDYLLPRVKKLEGARGCITLQLFFNKELKSFSALEINPRFGGGFPLSYSAGANYPGWLIDEYILQKEVSFFDGWESDLMMLRYDAKVLVRGAS